MALWSGHRFFSFDIVILCLTRECITMARCVEYIPDLCITLPLITKLYLTAAVAQSVRAFASQAEGLVFESQPRQNGSISVKKLSSGTKNSIQTNTWIWFWQNRFCSLTLAYQILVYGCITTRHVVYILELCMWVAGVSLASFTHRFYLVYLLMSLLICKHDPF